MPAPVISLVQTSPMLYSGSTNSITNTAFASPPAEGNLVIYTLWLATTGTISPPGGSGLTEKYTSQATIRRFSEFAKIAGASELTSYTFTAGATGAMWIVAREFNSSTGWQDVSLGSVVGAFAGGTSLAEITAASTSVIGSLLSSASYTSDSTANNKAVATGFAALHYSTQLGTSLRACQTWKTSTAANESATLSMVNSVADARISEVITEYLPVFPEAGPSIDTAADATIGESSAVTVSGFGDPIESGTIDGVDLSAAGDTSITLPGFVDEQPCPFPGLAANSEARTLSLTDGTDSDQIDIDVYPPWIDAEKTVRWVATPLSGTLNTTVNGVLHAYNPDAQVGDIMYNDPAKGLMLANGDYIAYTQHQTLWHHEAATRIVRRVPLDIGPGKLPRFISASTILASFITGSTVATETI